MSIARWQPQVHGLAGMAVAHADITLMRLPSPEILNFQRYQLVGAADGVVPESAGIGRRRGNASGVRSI
jgi:hypothetical protein